MHIIFPFFLLLLFISERSFSWNIVSQVAGVAVTTVTAYTILFRRKVLKQVAAQTHSEIFENNVTLKAIVNRRIWSLLLLVVLYVLSLVLMLILRIITTPDEPPLSHASFAIMNFTVGLSCVIFPMLYGGLSIALSSFAQEGIALFITSMENGNTFQDIVIQTRSLINKLRELVRKINQIAENLVFLWYMAALMTTCHGIVDLITHPSIEFCFSLNLYFVAFFALIYASALAWRIPENCDQLLIHVYTLQGRADQDVRKLTDLELLVSQIVFKLVGGW